MSVSTMIFSHREVWLFYAAIIVISTFGHFALASSATVDDLNERYINGQPSNDFGEAGIFLRMIDGICTPWLPDCDYNMANAPAANFFGGPLLVGSTNTKPNLVSSLKNDMYDTPKSKEYGEDIAIFESWDGHGAYARGPAAGFIYFPCSAESATRCMWPTDANSDKRNLTCSRQDPSGIPMMNVKGCKQCVAEESSVLLAEDNPITNRAVARFDDMPNDMTDTTSLQIELLYNRANNMTIGDIFETTGSLTKMKERELSSSCELCKSTIRDLHKSHNPFNLTNGVAFNWQLVLYEVKWYEGPGYYSVLDQEDSSSLVEPRNELKEMMEAQATYFGVNRDYSADVPPVVGRTGWNEFAIDGDTMNELESGRDYSTTLNLDGVDENDGTCGAAIKALILICGDQDDPFYYGTPGTCIDFPGLYKQHYGAEAAPEVVYMNRKNFTHPFSSTCDIQISCGVEGDNEDTSDNMGSSSAGSSSSLVLFSGYGYLILCTVIYILV